MKEFIYQQSSGRVRFSPGARHYLDEELATLNWQRVLIICTERGRKLAEEIASNADGRITAIFDQARMHVPVKTVAAAMQMAEEINADATVAIGGGSTVGLSKSLSLKKKLPSLAIPTTYSGSEMTSIWGMTQDGLKTTGKEEIVKPKVVIYDPELTTNLPMKVAGPSALNAMAHGMEALWAVDANPISNLFAEQGLRAFNSALPRLANNGQDMDAASDALYGAWLCGSVLAMCSMALHHKLCHVLGGTFNLPHAEVHALILPYATAYNADSSPQAMERAGGALGVNPSQVAGTVWDLREKLGAPGSLAQLGLHEQDLQRAEKLATSNPYPNPKPVTAEGIRELLRSAYRGERP